MAKLENIKENVSENVTVPHNTQAEQAILGALLANNEAMSRIEVELRPEHFYVPLHGRIYDAILRMNERSLVADAVTLKLEFDNDPEVKKHGGGEYLVNLARQVSGIINVKHYANIVFSLAVSRQMIDIGEDIVVEARDATGEERGSEQIERVEQRLFNLSSSGNSDTNFTSLKLSVNESIAHADRAFKADGLLAGVTTGFSSMNKLIGGFHNSDLIILAARPSMGKTALALNMALEVARKFKKDGEDKSVGVVSLEMSSEQLATRLLSVESGINASNIRQGKLQKNEYADDFAKLSEASNSLNGLSIFLDDTPALSVAALRTRARRLKRKHNLAFLVIDYLQLLRGVGKQGKENRVQEISEISMGLKTIAKELNIPVLALSQLSRAVEQREDKRPMLSDLRESGSIEQDADMVAFIYREAYYHERKKPDDGSEKFSEWLEKMEEVDTSSSIIIAKNRNGAIGNVELMFDKNTTRFADMEQNFDNMDF